MKKRYELNLVKFKSSKQILPHAEDIFVLLNKTYSSLQTFTPIQQYQVDM